MQICYRDRLSASDMLTMRKVTEHVWEKILYAPTATDGGGVANSASADNVCWLIDLIDWLIIIQTDPPSVPADVESRIELYCNEHRLEPTMDLRTVKHFLWKQSGDVLIHFTRIGAFLLIDQLIYQLML